ncbi:MAG: twin-arginine translocase TatA/TatE family subunit [Candidatus Kapaibacteriales bacterium]
MFGIGVQELILIGIIILILFGGRKIPELMRGLGQGIREFKKASSSEDIKSTEKNDSSQ